MSNDEPVVGGAGSGRDRSRSRSLERRIERLEARQDTLERQRAVARTLRVALRRDLNNLAARVSELERLLVLTARVVVAEANG